MIARITCELNIRKFPGFVLKSLIKLRGIAATPNILRILDNPCYYLLHDH